MHSLAAQISVYPLRRTSISGVVSRTVDALRVEGAEVRPGAMSTVISGSEDVVFAALRAGYRAATKDGDAVLVATISNACPRPTTGHNDALVKGNS